MSELERMQKVIAFGHVHANGDSVTRELVESLRNDRAAAVRESQLLAAEVARLRNDLIDAHRGGMTPAARQVVGRGVWALVAVSSITALILWFVGVAPVGRVISASVAPPPVRAGPSWVGQTMTFTALGPRPLIQAVMDKFSVTPTQIDTGAGHRLSMRYVDGPYSRMQSAERLAQATAIAKFVWHHPARPRGIDTISIRVERPQRAPGDTAMMSESFFFRTQLNRP